MNSLKAISQRLGFVTISRANLETNNLKYKTADKLITFFDENYTVLKEARKFWQELKIINIYTSDDCDDTHGSTLLYDAFMIARDHTNAQILQGFIDNMTIFANVDKDDLKKSLFDLYRRNEEFRTDVDGAF